MYVLLHAPIRHTDAKIMLSAVLYLFYFLVSTISFLFSTNWQGFNPMIHFTFSPTSNHTDIYQVTQEGLLIASTNELKPKQKHFLKVSLSHWKHLFKFSTITEHLICDFPCFRPITTNYIHFTLCQSIVGIFVFQIVPDNIVWFWWSVKCLDWFPTLQKYESCLRW